jgi:hypothetical protein
MYLIFFSPVATHGHVYYLIIKRQNFCRFCWYHYFGLALPNKLCGCATYPLSSVYISDTSALHQVFTSETNSKLESKPIPKERSTWTCFRLDNPNPKSNIFSQVFQIYRILQIGKLKSISISIPNNKEVKFQALFFRPSIFLSVSP